MKYFRHRPFYEDAFNTHTIQFAPNMRAYHYHPELVGVELTDEQVEEFLMFQHPECEVTEQTFEEVEAELKSCRFYHDINEIVKTLIKNKYSVEDEIRMLKLERNDPEYIAYEQYVEDCRSLGSTMKIEKGLKCTVH